MKIQPALLFLLNLLFATHSSAFSVSRLTRQSQLASTVVFSSVAEQPEGQQNLAASISDGPSNSTDSVSAVLDAATLPLPKREIPGWGKAINKALDMPMITHADKYHLHAISAVAWFLLAYGHLFPAWLQEFQSGEWGVFSQLATNHWLLMFSGTTMVATGLTMLPTRKSLYNYSAQMRSAMNSCATLIAMAGAFMLEGHYLGDTLPMGLDVMTKFVASSAFVYMLYEAAAEGRPWHILPIMDEMKLHNENAFVITVAYGLSIVWYLMTALCVAHAVLGEPGSLTDFSGSPLASAFAAQMAVSLAVTPANDALVAGTLMKNEVFLKTDKDRMILVNDPKVGLRQAYWLEMVQIVADYGPAFVTMGAAVACGHSELVSDFFYFDTIKELVSMLA